MFSPVPRLHICYEMKAVSSSAKLRVLVLWLSGLFQLFLKLVEWGVGPSNGHAWWKISRVRMKACNKANLWWHCMVVSTFLPNRKLDCNCVSSLSSKRKYKRGEGRVCDFSYPLLIVTFLQVFMLTVVGWDVGVIVWQSKCVKYPNDKNGPFKSSTPKTVCHYICPG